MTAASWGTWVRLLLSSLGVFTLLSLLVVLTYVHPYRLDLSPGNRYTLSDHALGILRDLDQPIKITGFIRTQDPRNAPLKDLLWQASHESPYITYSLVDINRNPSLAERKGVSAYGAVLVESKTRRRTFSNPSESQLVSAITQATRSAKRIVAVTGHGECDLNDRDRHRGCTSLRDAVSLEFYDLTAASLAGDAGLEDDVAVVLILGPKVDYLDVEMGSLRRYLDRGGNALVLLDPWRAPKLAAFMHRYGLAFGDDVIIDPDNRLAGGEKFSSVISDANPDHLVSATLDAPPLFSQARSVVARSDEEKRRVAVRLLRTGRRSWANHDPEVLHGAEARFVAGRDLNGPLSVGVEVVIPVEHGGERRSTRIIAFGDSDFVNNRFLDYLGNKDLLLNSINWLAQERHLVSSRTPSKKPGVEQFFISQAQLTRIFRWAVGIEPLMFMALGLAMFVRRWIRP